MTGSDSDAAPAIPPVGDSEAGQRLDRFLAAARPDLSRSRLKVLIEEGRVAHQQATITDPSARVKPGQAYTIDLPPPLPAQPRPQDIELAIVYQDDHLIVIDKPAGLVVHPAPGNPDTTLVNALLHHCAGTLSGIGGVKRPGIVHRLDKDTSGLMVAAKTDQAHWGLARQFAEHTLDRAYKAVVWGVPMPRRGEITGNIGRNPQDRKKMAIVNQGGKPALTRYQVDRAFGSVASLVECRLATGRTHQIRVHMTAQGHPLVGDRTYGNGRAARPRGPLSEPVRAALGGFPRQALHAFLIGFDHPATGQRLLFTSDLPYDFNMLINTLETVQN